MEADPVRRLSVADYLTSQMRGGARQEFSGDEAFPLDAGGAGHDRVRQNLFASLQASLLGGAHDVHPGNRLVRLEVGTVVLFYYPDVVVAERPLVEDEPFLRRPKLVIEVFSRSGEQSDCRGKKMFYVRQPSIEELVLVAECRREVRILRRAAEWRVESLVAPEATVEFRSVHHVMTVAQIYAGVF